MQAGYYLGKRQIEIRACVPRDPGPGEVQMRMSHCGICGSDLHVYLGDLDHRIKMPEVIGHEGAGVIAKLGSSVGGFAEGDRVAAMPIVSCGECRACRDGFYHVCQKLQIIGIERPGAMQSFWTVPAANLFRVPASLSMEHAALIEPTAVAVHDVRMANLQAGEYALVLGGGPIGALIAMVARAKGARVLVTEINPFRIKMLRDLGFEVVNPREDQWVDHVLAATGGAGADAVFEVTGVAAGAEMMTQALRSRGRVVIVGVFAKPVLVDLYKFFQRELSLTGARVYQREDFGEAIELLAAKTIDAPKLITNTMPLAKLRDGLEMMANGAPVMKILVECNGD